MLARNRSHWWGVVLDTPDPGKLARFYSRLLGWPIAKEEPSYAVVVPPGEGNVSLAFHLSETYERPVWPPVDGRQQMMAHLDIEIGDLDDAVARAIDDGATLAEFQPQEKVRVMLDPDGHPFCLYVDESAAEQQAAG